MVITTMKAQEVKTIRDKLGLTQEEMADALGVSKNSVQNWESGTKITPAKEKAIKRLLSERPHTSEVDLGAHVLKTEAMVSIMFSTMAELLAKANGASSVTSVHSQLKAAANQLLEEKGLKL